MQQEPSDELREMIHDDEAVQWVVEGRKPVIFLRKFVGKFVGALVVGGLAGVLVGGGVWFYATRQDAPILGYGAQTAGMIAGALAVVAFVLLVIKGPILEFLFGHFEYVATDERIIRYTGVFGRDLDSVPVDGVQDAEFSVGLVERMLDVGDVTVNTDVGVEDLYLHAVPDPGAVTTAVNEVASQHGSSDVTEIRESTSR